MTPPSAFHLAQINIARFTLPKDHPANQGFMTALDPAAPCPGASRPGGGGR